MRGQAKGLELCDTFSHKLSKDANCIGTAFTHKELVHGIEKKK
jgi:hypothetical protein